jgi:preprotein translocase subunit YajC
MSMFITDAWAQAAPAAQQQPNIIEALLPFIVLFVIFYFLLIRPQQKRAKEHKKMVESLSKGDEVVTTGGLLGKITKVGDNFVEIEVSDNVQVKIQRQMVGSVMPKGTIKNL